MCAINVVEKWLEAYREWEEGKDITMGVQGRGSTVGLGWAKELHAERDMG